MEFQGRHGVRDLERERAQPFRVDVDIDADLSAASESDHLADTIDYTLVRAAAKDVIEGRPRKLLESLAGEIARRVASMPGVEAVSVRVSKFPAGMQPLDAAAVRVNRVNRIK